MLCISGLYKISAISLSIIRVNEVKSSAYCKIPFCLPYAWIFHNANPLKSSSNLASRTYLTTPVKSCKDRLGTLAVRSASSAQKHFALGHDPLRLNWFLTAPAFLLPRQHRGLRGATRAIKARIEPSLYDALLQFHRAEIRSQRSFARFVCRRLSRRALGFPQADLHQWGFGSDDIFR